MQPEKKVIANGQEGQDRHEARQRVAPKAAIVYEAIRGRRLRGAFGSVS